MVRHRISRVGLVVTAAALAAAVSACSQGTNNAQAPAAGTTAENLPSSAGAATEPATQAPTQGTTASSDGQNATSTRVGNSAASASNLCKSSDLRLSLGGGDAGAGTTYRSLVFTNVSGRTCVIQGFPGVSYVGGDDGHQVGPAAYRDGTKGAPITLHNGESAFATVGFVNVHNFDPATCQPQPVRGLRVYPPQETASMYLEMPTTGCSSDRIPGNQLTVRTIQPGTGA